MVIVIPFFVITTIFSDPPTAAQLNFPPCYLTSMRGARMMGNPSMHDHSMHDHSMEPTEVHDSADSPPLLFLMREPLPAAPQSLTTPRAARAAKHGLKSQDTVVRVWVVASNRRRICRRRSR